jgi:hypothetical protein
MDHPAQGLRAGGLKPSSSQISDETWTTEVTNVVPETRANPRTGCVAMGTGIMSALRTCSVRDATSIDVNVKCLKSSLCRMP